VLVERQRLQGRRLRRLPRRRHVRHDVTTPDAPSLVALRDRREAAIQRLADSFAEDLITIDEFDDRVARAHAAATVAELDALVADLPAAAKSTALVPLAVDDKLTAQATKKRIFAVFGSVERRGAWIVPDRVSVSAVFGASVIDFRDAKFSSKLITLDATTIFGSLEVIVPPQLAVECDGSSIFGSIESHGGAAVSDPERPVLRITGTAVFGAIDVQVRLPGESARDARRRRRRERKALDAGRGRALPPHGGE
jgi:hypothetical protein